MGEEIKREWRRAIWSIVTVAVIALATSFVQSSMAQRSMGEQLKVLIEEQQVIRAKLDVMQIQLERKVDRNVLDNCLNRIDTKLDKIADNIFKIQQGQ